MHYCELSEQPELLHYNNLIPKMNVNLIVLLLSVSSWYGQFTMSQGQLFITLFFILLIFIYGVELVEIKCSYVYVHGVTKYLAV